MTAAVAAPPLFTLKYLLRMSAMAYVAGLIALGVLIAVEGATFYGALSDPLRIFVQNWRLEDPIIWGFSLGMTGALIIAYLCALWMMRESSIAMIGLTLVMVWLVVATAAPLFDLPDPNTTARSRSGRRLPMSVQAREIVYWGVAALLVVAALWTAVRRGATYGAMTFVLIAGAAVAAHQGVVTLSGLSDAVNGAASGVSGALGAVNDATFGAGWVLILLQVAAAAAVLWALSQALSRLNLSAWFAILVLLALAICWLAFLDYPEAGRRGDRNMVGDVYHWLGTDDTGRDMLSRMVWGTQRVLLWATAATLVAYTVGALFGVAAGYLGGWNDEIISFVANLMLSFPVMVIYILIITYLGGGSGFNVVIAVTFASAPGIMRIVRGLTLDLKTRDYIAAAQTRGESRFFIMLVELLPNARGPLIVDSCLRLGYTIIAIATLGFLGLGLQPPDPDWGTMLKDGSGPIVRFQQSKLLIPAISVSSLILGFNLLADGLRDISLRD